MPLFAALLAVTCLRLQERRDPVTGGADLKYIDPTYMLRAVPASVADNIYCKVLAFNAVDAAFAGASGVCVGQVYMFHLSITHSF